MLQGGNEVPAVLHAQEVLGCMAMSDLHPGAIDEGRGRQSWGVVPGGGVMVCLRELYPGVHQQAPGRH